MTDAIELAAALNECMPIGDYREARAFGPLVTLVFDDEGRRREFSPTDIIGILWAECVRRGWEVSMMPQCNQTAILHGELQETYSGTDCLAFARAFAAAKKETGT